VGKDIPGMLESYRDLIDGLLETPTNLRDLLGDPVGSDLSDEVLAILREFRVREGVQLTRIQKVMFQRTSRLRSIETEVAQALNNAGDATTGEQLLHDFGTDRGEVVSLLINLTLSDWDRPVEDETLGEITFEEEIERHLEWDEATVERVRGLL
jgi:hypothetical protein